MKKVNPRRRPATQADVLKAKEGYGTKRLRRLWDEVNYLSESVSSGRVNIRDLAETLRDDAGITLAGLLT